MCGQHDQQELQDILGLDDWHNIEGYVGHEAIVCRVPLDVVVAAQPRDDNELIHLPARVGVYAFHNRTDVEFLYVGESSIQGVRVRAGQHMTPRDLGGNLRRNWCAEHCADERCGGRQACCVDGAAFAAYRNMLRTHCDLWSITWDEEHAADGEVVAELERTLIRITNPRYQDPG